MKKYLVPAHKLQAYDVINTAGEDLGQVQEFMIDMTTGRVAFAVVSYGGTLGFSDKWFAMPFESLCWSPDRKKFTVDLKPEVLKQAPGIDKNKWPEKYTESDTGWLNDLYEHYSCKPYWGDEFALTPTKQMSVTEMKSAMLEQMEMPAPKMEPVMPEQMGMEMPAPKKEAIVPNKWGGKFEIFKDKAGEFRFRLVASNGQIVLASEGYGSKSSAMEGIKSVQNNAPGAMIEDLAASMK